MPVWETIHNQFGSLKNNNNNVTFWTAHWFEFINSWCILKTSRNCTRNCLARILTNTNSPGEIISHWFKDLWKPVARQIRQWTKFHKRAPAPLSFNLSSFPDSWLPFAVPSTVSGKCCLFDSFLVEIIKQMFSLQHQRSNFKWRKNRQNIKNNREINTSRLTPLQSDLSLCVRFLDTVITRIQ